MGFETTQYKNPIGGTYYDIPGGVVLLDPPPPITRHVQLYNLARANSCEVAVPIELFHRLAHRSNAHVLTGAQGLAQAEQLFQEISLLPDDLALLLIIQIIALHKQCQSPVIRHTFVNLRDLLLGYRQTPTLQV